MWPPSDIVWQALIGAIVAVYLDWSNKRAARKTVVAIKKVGADAAEKVEEVATKLELTDTRATDTADKTLKGVQAVHTLVNSQHGVALSTIYEQALRLASLTGLPEDHDKAKAAKVKLDEHEQKQASVDRTSGANSKGSGDE